MARKASGQGRQPPKAGSPKTSNRQSSGASKPTGKGKRALSTPGGDPQTSHHGDHLQGNVDKGGQSSYK